jgi:hypothetical protein
MRAQLKDGNHPEDEASNKYGNPSARPKSDRRSCLINNREVYDFDIFHTFINDKFPEKGYLKTIQERLDITRIKRGGMKSLCKFHEATGQPRDGDRTKVT